MVFDKATIFLGDVGNHVYHMEQDFFSTNHILVASDSCLVRINKQRKFERVIVNTRQSTFPTQRGNIVSFAQDKLKSPHTIYMLIENRHCVLSVIVKTRELGYFYGTCLHMSKLKFPTSILSFDKNEESFIHVVDSIPQDLDLGRVVTIDGRGKEYRLVSTPVKGYTICCYDQENYSFVTTGDDFIAIFNLKSMISPKFEIFSTNTNTNTTDLGFKQPRAMEMIFPGVYILAEIGGVAKVQMLQLGDTYTSPKHICNSENIPSCNNLRPITALALCGDVLYMAGNNKIKRIQSEILLQFTNNLILFFMFM